MSFARKKAYFPTNLFFTHAQKPKFGLFLRIYFDFLSRSLFSFAFLFHKLFCCPRYRLSFAWNCGWLTFQQKGQNLIFKE